MTDPDRRTIAANWFELLHEGNIEELVSLYSQRRLSFHPTLWNEQIASQSRVRDYFHEFFARTPYVHSHDGEVLSFGETTFLYTGTVQLSFGLENQDTSNSITARFSFIWSRSPQGQWEIIHHHNSVVPTGL